MQNKTKLVLISTMLLSALLCNAQKNITYTKKDSLTFHQDSLAFVLCEIYGSDQGLRKLPRM